MANYIATTRTNYFHVIDEDKYSKLLESLDADDFKDFTEMEEDGKLIHGFGCYGTIYSEDDEFYEGIREILPDDEAFMQFEVGNEKLRYVAAYATIVTKKEGIKVINMDNEAKQYAKSVLGENYTTVTEY